MQSKGIYVIPNVRWGDERTYTTKFLPEKIAFKGIQKNSIVSIGAYGQIQNKVNRYYFLQGLNEMIKELEPKVVLVYGKLPEEIKEETEMFLPTSYNKVKFEKDLDTYIDRIVGFGFLVEPKHQEGEKRYRIHRIIKEKVTLDDLSDFKNQLNNYDTGNESL